MIIAGLIAGTIAGAILLFLSHLAPYVGAGDFVSDMGQVDVMGSKLTRREGQYLGMLVHMACSAGFGAAYIALVRTGVIADLSLLHLLEWSGVMTLFVGGVVMPLEGHGVFGIKEDTWFPIDLLVTNVGWGLLFWWLVPPWLAALR